MTAYAAVLPTREVPLAPASTAALRAWIAEDAHGGAVVTIGTIACPYANAQIARTQLEAMAARGLVYIEGKEPCLTAAK
jgi:hypothetical protein